MSKQKLAQLEKRIAAIEKRSDLSNIPLLIVYLRFDDVEMPPLPDSETLEVPIHNGIAMPPIQVFAFPTDADEEEIEQWKKKFNDWLDNVKRVPCKREIAE